MLKIKVEQELCEAIQTDESCVDGISRIAGRPIMIYGAGNYGRIMYRLLTENGIQKELILGFLDKAATEGSMLFNIPVFRPDDPKNTKYVRKEAVIIVSIYCGLDEQAAITAQLHELGYDHVRTCYETAISFYIANNPAARISTSDFLRKNMENILRGCDVWEDERSLNTYMNHFIGYARCDVGRFLLERDHKQYFASLGSRGYKRFIDCGAFDGDTIRDLMNISGKVERLALFEPSSGNFEKLQTYIRGTADSLAEDIVLFPCGVWDRTEPVRFDGSASAASNISEAGDAIIQCVALDDVLHGFVPTFIKMDIEGAEPRALRGAALMISRHKPDLAISVYHSLAHFWEIPELIRQWCPEYRFHLRTYGAAGFETILYAVAK